MYIYNEIEKNPFTFHFSGSKNKNISKNLKRWKLI